MSAAPQTLNQYPDSAVYPSLPDIQEFLQGFTGLPLSPNSRLASPFETPQGSARAEMDRMSEAAVEKHEVKTTGFDDGVEGTLDAAAPSSGNCPLISDIDSGSSTQSTPATRTQDDVDGLDVMQNVERTEDQNAHDSISPSCTEALMLGGQTPSSHCSQYEQPMNDLANTQRHDNREPNRPTTDNVPGSSAVVPIIDTQGFAWSDGVESKDFAKKRGVAVEGDLTAEGTITDTLPQVMTLSLEDAPKLGESSGDTNGRHRDAGETSNSRVALESSSETPTLNQGMYSSKYTPAPPQHNRFPHAGAFLQKYEHLPRAPRRPQFGNHPQYERADPRDDARATQSSLRQAQQTLQDERRAHKLELERVEARARYHYEAALQQITSDILGQQAATVKQTVHLKEKEFDLNAREGLVRKIEYLLAVGQKQFAGAEADDQDLETFLDINEEIVRERVTREIGRRDRKVDAQLAIKREELKSREAAIDMREKAYSAIYKAEVADKLEAKIRAEVEQEIAARETSEYDRGLAEGKAEGQVEGNEQLRHTWYDKGYAACHTMFERMKRFQAGLLAPDSPEIAFLFDPSHPDYPFSRGLQMGRRDAAVSSQPSPAVNESSGAASLLRPTGPAIPIDTATTNGNSIDTPARQHPYAHTNGHPNGATDRPVRDQEDTPLRSPFAASAKPHPFAGRTNGLTNGTRNDTTPPSPTDPNIAADPSFGVPQYGPRTAPRSVHPSLQNATPQTPATDGATTEGSSVGRSGNEVPTFLSGRRLLSYGRVEGEDEKMHRRDVQVDLIDLY